MEKFKVGDWHVCPDECTLTSATETRKIEPKAMELLSFLAEANGEVVSRDSILETVWKGRFISDYALNNLVSSLRKHLDSENQNTFIKTRPKKGYQLVQPAIPITTSQNPDRNNNTIRKSSLNHWLTYSTLAFVAVCILIYVALQNELSEPESTKPVSIAVLPFAALGGDEDIGYFADGLVGEVIHQLTKNTTFRVIAKTSSSTFIEGQNDTRNIADKLGVDYLVLGSVTQERELIQVNIQLIDTQSEATMWSQKFAASIDSVLNIQNQISTQLADTLGAEWKSNELGQNHQLSVSGDAYLHWLRGRKYNQIRTPESLINARNEFTMATRLDPNFADAYVDLGIAYLLMARNKMMTAEEASKQSNAVINKALSISPDLPSANAALGVLAYSDNRIADAKSYFETALATDPNHYLASINFANLLRTHFDKKEALSTYQAVLDLDPLSSAALWGVGNILIALGRFDEAIENYQQCVYRLPNDFDCKYGLAYASRLTGENKVADNVFAETIGQETDYYHRTAYGWHALWTGRLQEANDTYNKIFGQFGFNINALQSITLTKLALDEEHSWYDKISETFDSGDNTGLAVSANYAHVAFFTHQCETAIAMYESIAKSGPQLFTDLDILANGMTYYAMLAHCYQATGNNEDFIKARQQLGIILTNLPENSRFVGGFEYAFAQYYALNEKNELMLESLALLRENNWSLNWLIEKNPIFNKPKRN